MNWISESHRSWNWLQWMREVIGDGGEPITCLPPLIRGMSEWDDVIASDRHGTGDPARIATNEYFLYAASMMSRAAKTAIGDALKHAITWGVDDPMGWPSLPPEAKDHWEAAYHVITTVLKAWRTLWNDLAELQDKVSGTSDHHVLEQWKHLADQAVQTIEGLAVAARAQRDAA